MPVTNIDDRYTEVGNGSNKGQISTTHDNIEGKLRSSVQSLLGNGVRLSEQMSLGDLDLYSGVNHTTTGIPYAIHGTAKVVNATVATWLAGFDDPIKSIMPVTVHKDQKVIIKRKYVVGGSAIITPERAPARTVAVREDEREVLLTRYGGDLEMNLNLFLRPEDAREELNMKLNAQRQELENVMIQIGYETVMREGVNIMEALGRANPAIARLSTIDRQFAIEKTYIHSIFGCMNKHSYPVENLLAAAAKANLYTPTGSRRNSMAVMIVPPGMMDITKFTRESEMNFSVSGLKKTEHGVMKMPLSNVLEDRTSNLKIMVHLPPPSNQNGAAYPQVETSGLMSIASWGTYYPVPEETKTRSIPNEMEFRITDFKNRTWATFDGKTIRDDATAMYKSSSVSTKLADAECILVRPKFSAMMQSAILCTAPGNNSGELLMAYPQTGVSTSQTVESMKMQLRVYLGAAVYQPENFIILPDVAFAGAVSGHGAKICPNEHFNPEDHDLIMAFKTKSFDGCCLMEDEVFRETAGKIYYGDYYDYFNKKAANTPVSVEDEPKIMGTDGEGVPLTFYQGRTEIFDALGKWVTATRNFGHLGRLDDPELSDQIEGMQKYQVVPPEGR